MKQLTCGLIILNEHDQILMGKVTGQQIYDLPKGRTDDGEEPFDTMCRETYEEFGINVNTLGVIADLGQHAYNKEKRIHLFLTYVQKCSIDMNSLHCSSYFPHHATGIETPEVCGYDWIEFKSIDVFCGKSMNTVLKKVLIGKTVV